MSKQPMIARVDIKTLHAYMRCAHSARDFLNWFRVFIGESAFAEINCDELRELQDCIKELDL
jgi:hypothetical protein